MSVKIGGREYDDEEFGELLRLGTGTCAFLRGHVKKPVDLLVVLALAAVTCDRAMIKGGGGLGVPASEALRSLTRAVEERVDVVAIRAGSLPWRPPAPSGTVN